MRTRIKNLFLASARVVAGLALILDGRVTAQTFTTLHSFTITTPRSDGASPNAGLILSSNTLFGTTVRVGSYGRGTVFAVNTDGTSFAALYSFTGFDDGAYPWSKLVLAGNTLYGTAQNGGIGGDDLAGGNGTVFAVNTDGSSFTTVYSFSAASGTYPWLTNSDGALPFAGLILSGNTLYGTATFGGCSGNGTVFAVNTNGTGFTNLHSFSAGSLPWPSITNSDGARPSSGLILSGNTLYGTAPYGGFSGNGTVFSINTDGTSFANLHSFTGGSDGAGPSSGLILSGNTLYGTAGSGGISGNGTVFAVNIDGTGFTTLHDFTAASGSYPNYINSEGAYPQSDLILSGNTLYGTAKEGGSSGRGTVFAVNIDGTGFATLHNFTAPAPEHGANSDGVEPNGGLILSGNTLYGTAWAGGSSGSGTVFSLSLPPPRLRILPSEADVILTWPTNASGYTLQSTTNLFSSPVWRTVSPGPVVVKGQYAVTNPISGTQRYYRLSQ